MNESSLLIRLVLRLLGAHHPIRLSVGIAIGVIAKMGVTTMAATYQHPSLLALAGYPAWYYVIACAPLMYASLLVGKKGAPESIVHQINTVDALLDKSGLSATDKKFIWRSLINRYIEQAKPDLSGTPDVGALVELELKTPKGSDPATP